MNRLPNFTFQPLRAPPARDQCPGDIDNSATGTSFHGPLPGPDLIIQDELHLISVPLGTIAGVYETATENLASRKKSGKIVRPKIIASTATVRRAEHQIRALFGRL